MQTEEKVLEQGSDTSKIYEVGYHLVPVIAPERVADYATEIKALITKNKCEIISEGEPKNVDLAYMIPKVVAGQKVKAMKAYFGWVKFEGEAEAVLAIQKALMANEYVLRFLLIKTVRENTMIDKKLLGELDEEGNVEAPKEVKDAPKEEPKKAEAAEKPAAPEKAEKKAKKAVSEEELDKSIDNLLA